MSSTKKNHLVSVLDELSIIKELQGIPGYMEEFERLRERLADDEFMIAVVGEFSSGKSTFINAMLGQDVLQHATTETTATVTRIVNVEQNDPRRMTGKVTTRDGKIILMPDLKNLKEYTTTQSDQYQNRVPEEIASVEVYLPFMVLSRPVVLVDTPGLNGMADGHREQTVALIQKSHACIYLIPRGGLGESDILFISYLAKFQKNFIFIQNFIDELRESEGDSVPKKLEEQRGILDQKIFSDNPECTYDICGISALMELASADQRIKRLYADSPELLMPEDRRRLHEQSGFEDFRIMMSKTFHEDRMDEIQYGGTARAIANWIRTLLDHIARQEQQARDFFEASRDKRALEKLEHLRDKILAGESRQRENLNNFILAKGDNIQKEECKTLRNEFEELNIRLANQMNAIKKVSELEQFERKLTGLLENNVGSILMASNVRLQQRFQTLYQILLTKIDEYSGVKMTEDLNLDSLKLNYQVEKQPTFTAAQSRIDTWKKEKENATQELEQLQHESCGRANDLRTAQNAEEAIRRSQRDIETHKQRELSGMGSRPSAREYEEPYTVKKYRGGLGIWDKLFGPKEVTRYRTVRDDSAGESWDRRRAQIQNAYTVRRDDLSRQLAAARRKKAILTGDWDANQKKIVRAEEKIRMLEASIRLEGQKLEKEKQQATIEYMNHRRTSLQNQVKEYLTGESGVLNRMEINIGSMAQEIGQSFNRLAMERFTKAMNQKMQWIDQMKREKSPQILQQAENLKGICEQLKSILKEMERVK